MLALRNKTAIRAAYLDRVAQRMALRVAEDKFTPQPSLTFSGITTSTYQTDGTRTRSTYMDAQFGTILTLPTGGIVSFTWDNPAVKPDVGQDYTYSSGWNITFTQPLLRNAGYDVTTQSVRQARIAEEQAVLDLRDTLVATITAAITNYRAYLLALRNYEIQVKGLETAKQTLATNQALIDAGRMARTEILQAENDVAIQELSVITAQNGIDSSRLALMQTLDIDRNTQFVPMEEQDQRVALPTLEEATTLALRNRSDYLKALQNVDLAQLDLAVKKRGRLWDLTLVTGAGRSATDEVYRRTLGNLAVGKSDWNMGLFLTVPLRDLATESAFVSAWVTLEKARINLKKLVRDIEIDVQNKLRDADFNYRSYLLSRKARELAEKKLSIEQEKLKVGRTTNFQLVSFQNDVIDQRTAELQALITYRNSLTALDQSLGIVLNRWNIVVKREDEDVRLPEGEKGPAGGKATTKAE